MRELQKGFSKDKMMGLMMGWRTVPGYGRSEWTRELQKGCSKGLLVIWGQ
jgi:hypothetical protein